MTGYGKRRRGIREEFNIIYIICEGEKTEKQYFESFKRRYSNLNIMCIHEGYTDPKNIVICAKERKKQYSIDKEKGDGIWCVFDVNSNTNAAIISAVEIANEEGIEIALSNPSFEFWYLLHYEYRSGHIGRKDVITRLKKYIKHYDKAVCYYDILNDRLETATNNAKELNKMHAGNQQELFCRESNPSTQVFKLVEFINESTRRNQALRL